MTNQNGMTTIKGLAGRLLLPVLLSVTLAGPVSAQETDTAGGMPTGESTQPDPPVDEWTDKTVLVMGAHPDDDSQAYGTLSMLQENGNDIHVLIMTTGNVGTKDPDMTRNRLSKIRRAEEVEALAVLGIPEGHYINLGYTDGMLEFADEEEVVRRLVYHIRRLQPDVLIAFDPGFGYQTWHKTDHRAAAYLAADAARAAEWRLLFPGQINHDGLEAHRIQEYMFFGGPDKDKNLHVDISGAYAEDKGGHGQAHEPVQRRLERLPAGALARKPGSVRGSHPRACDEQHARGHCGRKLPLLQRHPRRHRQP